MTAVSGGTAVPVAVEGRPYEVMIGPGLIERASALIRPLLRRPR